MQSQSPDIWKCFEFQETPAFQLLQLAGTLLVDGEAIYMARIIDYLTRTRALRRGVEFPVQSTSSPRSLRTAKERSGACKRHDGDQGGHGRFVSSAGMFEV